MAAGPTLLLSRKPGPTNSPEVPTAQRSISRRTTTTISLGNTPKVFTGNGDYAPVGTVLVNEEAAERAFAGSDNNKRYHFNLPATLKPTDQLLVTFDANNLDTSGTDPQYGIEIYFNDVMVQPEILIRNEQLDIDYTTAPFTLASVHAETGPGWDNIVTLKGINHSADGGGAWMGIDYVQLNPMPVPVFPWAVGRDDDGWPTGSAAAPNTTFVQENGSINDLPGNPNNREINQQGDNDYYFAGVYNKVIAANGAYEPVGIVVHNEESAERAFAAADNELRYHFNLPSTLQLTNQVAVTFDPFNLDDPSDVNTDVRYGVEVYFNNVLVQPQIIIRTNQLGVAQTTPPFTLASVNAQLGLGADNIVSLRGVNYNAEGGGNWMGFDYVALNAAGDTGQPLKFLTSTASSGKLTLTWSGTGNLERGPSVTGPWTAVAPAPNSPYTEDIVLGQVGRFYRLKKP